MTSSSAASSCKASNDQNLCLLLTSLTSFKQVPLDFKTQKNLNATLPLSGVENWQDPTPKCHLQNNGCSAGRQGQQC